MASFDSPTFPVRPHNRAALAHLRYRLGAYSDIRDAMFRQLNAASVLEKWTHRGADDPGIALLESAAVVADILTFYQEHYANEAFLRTATWHESVQELIRLTGYRLAPGVGGRASFAVEVRGTAPVVVPAGFPLKADLQNLEKTVDFLTTDEHTAHPHLGRFNLYRRRNLSTGLSAHSTTLELFAIGGSEDPDVLMPFDLKKGDQLMLVPAAPAWVSSGSSLTGQKAPQIVKVSKVTPRLGRFLVEIEGRVEESWSGNVTAYRVNRTFRHFGHNMPPKTTYQEENSDGDLVSVQRDSYFTRHVAKSAGHVCSDSPDYLYTPVPIDVLPLDQEVKDLSLGAKLVVEFTVSPTDTEGETLRALTLVYTIKQLQALTMSWGNVNGPSTWVRVQGSRLISNLTFTEARADIRLFRIHETTSPALSLRNPSYFINGFVAQPNQLFHYSSAAEAETLVDRRLYFQNHDGRFAFATVVAVDAAAPSHVRLRQVTLDQIPKDFRRQDFDETTPTTDVFGNLVDVTQGKAEPVVPLGNGDARQSFQTFQIPKAPLTYLLDPAATPSTVPELTVRANGREWTQVDSLFGRGPLEEVYVVREDPDGNSFVQFGDGETGARLPSGINNITAQYRSGNGAFGPIKAGAKPSAGTKLDQLDKLTLAGEVYEGAAAEDFGKARIAAPGKLQSLGRLVSLADYEAETLQLAGVITTTASWEILDGVPSIHLCVLLDQARQSDEQFASLEAVLRDADEARGPNRHPIAVTQGELRYVYLTLTYASDPLLLANDVESAIRAALGLVADEAHAFTGLFGLKRRRLGEKEYASRIEGTVQNVPGLVWCRVDALDLLPPADDPLTLTVPATPVKTGQVACGSTELLQLHPLHFTLVSSSP